MIERFTYLHMQMMILCEAKHLFRKALETNRYYGCNSYVARSAQKNKFLHTALSITELCLHIPSRFNQPQRRTETNRGDRPHGKTSALIVLVPSRPHSPPEINSEKKVLRKTGKDAPYLTVNKT